ncbi:MAG: FliM/FliN family flagellar motor switch protein, partial [bacterium]
RVKAPDFEEIRDVESDDDLERELASLGSSISPSPGKKAKKTKSDIDDSDLLDDGDDFLADMADGDSDLDLDEDLTLNDELLDADLEEDLSLENEILGEPDEEDLMETDSALESDELSLDDDMDTDLDSIDADLDLGSDFDIDSSIMEEGDEFNDDEKESLDLELSLEDDLDEMESGLSMGEETSFLSEDISLDESEENHTQSIVLDESMEVTDLDPDEIDEGETELTELDEDFPDLDAMEETTDDYDDNGTTDLSVSDDLEPGESVIELSDFPVEEDVDLGADMFSDDIIDEESIELSELEEMDENGFIEDSDMDLSEPVDDNQSYFVSLSEEKPIRLDTKTQETASENKPGTLIGKELLFKLTHQLRVEIGQANLKGEDITSLTYGSVIELDRKKGEPVDIILGSKVIAKGEVVQINEEQLGVRITRINY